MKGNTHCEHRTNDDLNPELRENVIRIEAILGYELTVNSGVRCPECNAKVGGVPDSAHLTGEAIDAECSHSSDRFDLINALIKQGIIRFGIGKDFIHFDISKTLPQNVVWTYY